MDPGLPVYLSSNVGVGGPDSGFSFPPDTFLPGFESPIYGLGDELLFDTPIPSEINLKLTLVGGQIQWQDSDCATPSANGADGDTLGCIAKGVAWMTYSVYLLDGGQGAVTPARRSPSSNHHLQVHSDWEPLENCTTKCMLLEHTPQHTWTPVGNGTYNGIYHELHFMHTDNFMAHRAVQGVFEPVDDNATLAARAWVQYNGHLINTQGTYLNLDLYSKKSNAEELSYAATFNEYSPPIGIADWMGESVEESVALSSYSGFCFTLLNGGVVESTSLLGISQTGSDWGSAGDVEQDLANCEAEDADGNHIGNGVLVCGANASWVDPSWFVERSKIAALTRSLHNGTSSLDKRTGAQEAYAVQDPGGGPTVWFVSATYPNGNNGANLQEAGGDDHVFSLANPGICWDASIRDDAPIDGPNAIVVHAEHLLERNTIPDFLGFLTNPEMDILDGNGIIRVSANLRAIPFEVIRDYMNIPYAQWTGLPFPALQTLFYDIAEALGSTINPSVMTNLEAVLNGVKTLIWQMIQVAADDVWQSYVNIPTTANTALAMRSLQEVSEPYTGVFTSSEDMRLSKYLLCRVSPSSTI